MKELEHMSSMTEAQSLSLSTTWSPKYCQVRSPLKKKKGRENFLFLKAEKSICQIAGLNIPAAEEIVQWTRRLP